MKVKELIGKTVESAIPLQVDALGMIPLISTAAKDLVSPLLFLDEAAGNASVEISEAGKDGLVPFLLLRNKGTVPILILEGEELVGGKQNRIVNTTILALPGTDLSIPVSCMEQGRWDMRSTTFASGQAIFRARSRAQQKAKVSETLQRGGSFSGDQSAVWDEVKCSLAEMEASSPTADFRAVRERVSDNIEKYVAALPPIAGQVGAIFYSASAVIGCELLATPDLYVRAVEKIVRSFVFEALDQPPLREDRSEAALAWLQRVLSAPAVAHESPGAGEDLRISTRDVIGSGLIWHNHLLHLSCFPQSQSSCRNGSSDRVRRQPASARKRRMQQS